jgi:dGTPase
LKLVSIEEMTSVQLIRDALERTREKYTNLSEDLTRKSIVHQLVERQVTSLISHCAGELQDRAFSSATQAMNSDFLIEHPDELAEQKRELEAFLYRNVYRHPDLVKVRQRAQERLKEMYIKYCERPDLFPEKYQARCEKVGVRRMAVEYIAGMTDRFCEQTYARICQ